MRRQALAARPVEMAFFQNITVAVLLLAAVPLMGLPPAAATGRAAARGPAGDARCCCWPGPMLAPSALFVDHRIFSFLWAIAAWLAGVRRDACPCSLWPGLR